MDMSREQYNLMLNNDILRNKLLDSLADDGRVDDVEGKELKALFAKVFGKHEAEGLNWREFRDVGNEAAQFLNKLEAAGEGDDIETVILRACLSRLKAIEDELRSIAGKIKSNNAAAADAMNKPENRDSSGNLTQDAQNKLAGINAIQQEDLIQLQVLVQRRGEAAEMLSNVLKAFASTRKAIVGNVNG